jgi:predicted MFS family arabinose efflux permease
MSDASPPEPLPESGPRVSLASYYRLVRANPNYRRLWFAQIISQLGDWFYAVAIYDLILKLTGSAQLVGTVVLLQILPIFMLGPTAGAVNDRISRRRVMITADLVRAVVVLGMWFVRTPGQLWLLFPLLIFEVSSLAFFEPGRSAIIPNLVARADILTANSLSSVTWSFTLAIGAGIGGLAIHWLGRETAFIINSASFVLSAFLLARIHVEEPHIAAHRHLGWADALGLGPVLEGVRYVKGDPRLTALLFVKCGLGLLGANMVLLPVFGEHVFRLPGAEVLGISTLFMFRGVGAAFGPLLGSRIAGTSQRRLRLGVLAGYLLAGFFYLLFSRAPSLALASACIVGAHMGGSSVWVFSTTLLQLNTEDRFRGRVFAADFGLNMLTASLSAYTVGFAMDHGVAPRAAALTVGLAMSLPALAWLSAQRLWRDTEQ